MIIHPKELEFRRRWYLAHVERFEADAVEVAKAAAAQGNFAASAEEALVLRDALARSGDVEAFRAGLQEWAVKPGTLAFNGMSGQMFVNQLAKRSEDPALLARILTDSLSVPRDDADAATKIQAFIDYVETIRVGAHPAPSRATFLLSYFWALQDRPRWPVAWSSAVAYLEYSTGHPLPARPVERFLSCLDLVRELDDDVGRFEQVAMWWQTTTPVFLDPVLVERCAFGLDPEIAHSEAGTTNAAVLVSIAQHIGTAMADELSAAVGRTLSARKPPKLWMADYPRSDLWVDWSLGPDSPGLRLWINHDGAAFGVKPGFPRRGWYEEIVPFFERAGVEGLELLGGPGRDRGRDVGFQWGRYGEFVYGSWHAPETFGELDLRASLVATGVATQPLLDELIRRAGGEPPIGPEDALLKFVAEFRDRGYPSPADEEHKADREQFADLLAEDSIALADPADLRRIWNTNRYGGPGPQAVLNTSLRDSHDEEYDRILDSMKYLCWGEGDDGDRIDKLLDVEGELYVKGLGEAVIMKLLAICHPDRYLPVYPYSGPKGKRRMLQLLELAEPSEGTRGELQVAANDLLRERLARFFPDDPWGMAQFLYWYAEREIAPPPVEVDPLEELAEELLVERAFLDDIVALLEDKGQVILYGPPGTGKTYLARKLAEALVPDPTRRSLVQFHPSTSYEDFFEGYRPETDIDGDMSYRLTPGPLALLAERAADAPGKRHIMIIDEINRANLPKVLGELLFLFEYRGEQVRTLYRPDDAFELPKDLWFIGTMNTADRSIALVDAALRRRFHFVPFFPDHGAMAGLLERWLTANGQPGWVGELVAMVNDELVHELGGPHLQLGPSHFMKSGIDEGGLRRIWEYNIEPFMEDQFFGDAARIDFFRFGSVLPRYLSSVDATDLGTLGASEAAEAADGPVPIARTELPAAGSEEPVADNGADEVS